MYVNNLSPYDLNVNEIKATFFDAMEMLVSIGTQKYRRYYLNNDNIHIVLTREKIMIIKNGEHTINLTTKHNYTGVSVITQTQTSIIEIDGKETDMQGLERSLKMKQLQQNALPKE